MLEAERQRLRTNDSISQAEESSRLKEEFLATISHELRTPLSAILGWARMLRLGQLSPENTAKALDTIERNARAQAQLVDDLLDVSRIITGKLRMDVRPADPNSFIDAAVEAVRPAAEAKGVRVQKVIDTGRHLNSRRSRETATSRLEFTLERDQVHAAWWSGADSIGESEFTSRDRRQRYRPGNFTGFSAARFRSFSPGGPEDEPAAWRHGTGFGDRAPSRRTAWRHGARATVKAKVKARRSP